MVPRPLAIVLLLVAAIGSSCSAVPRPGDPAIYATDQRMVDCGIAPSDAWMAFGMARARDFTLHFPGWSEGAEELEVDTPALVVIRNGDLSPRGGDEHFYEMCIAVGLPGDAVLHRYGGTRFDAIRPVLGGPLVPMP
jgi:hypothetical protein